MHLSHTFAIFHFIKEMWRNIEGDVSRFDEIGVTGFESSSQLRRAHSSMAHPKGTGRTTLYIIPSTPVAQSSIIVSVLMSIPHQDRQ
jgi:hypothetical protein